MRYAALLRGINVGGNNRVEMDRLKDLFTEMGFQDVVTYLNTGNVIFTARTKPSAAEVQKRIAATFGLDVPVLLLDANTVCRIAKSIPESWRNDADQKSDVCYLFPEVDDATVVMKVGCNADVETGLYVPGAFLWNIERRYYSRGSLPKIVGTKLYAQMTLRNVNTARKLAELLR
jgi:uncharacterized protein (DUF1697 family)